MSPSRSRYTGSYPYACSMVYDLRNYTDETMWGPFLDQQATVDWEKMEAVMIVLQYHLHGHNNYVMQPPWLGASVDSFKSVLLPKIGTASLPSNPDDPYDVTGSWIRVVCFLDYQELSHYNFGHDDILPEEPRGSLYKPQSIRLIMMKLQVTKIEEADSGDGQVAPVVYFEGTSRSLHIPQNANANSNIRGSVRQTSEGEIRWTTYSIYNGEERWKSEGIQVGGPRSSGSVMGHWFDRDMDPHGPVGPTMFWKVSNNINDLPGDELVVRMGAWTADYESEGEWEENGEDDEGGLVIYT
ncbi:uncharacterized protein BP5553_00975 [Venustampulla echinocandica]|uniref:Uncharacterized protein n=1 Tax=Venustampulla echinocandica TaxID=2656787 RepID=A0A370TZP2_9HELO|nr:uncharacterized protein BP5553_00975 [Venustampulla echinocandica]RDL40996.1 hypothetical protein BP5553_00975 [Venustampulla echinocandica]